jgi:hypothetical protein
MGLFISRAELLRNTTPIAHPAPPLILSDKSAKRQNGDTVRNLIIVSLL